jgi:hypothetical protein
MNFFTFFYFCGLILPSWIRIRIPIAYPDLAYQIHAQPDPQHELAEFISNPDPRRCPNRKIEKKGERRERLAADLAANRARIDQLIANNPDSGKTSTRFSYRI